MLIVLGEDREGEGTVRRRMQGGLWQKRSVRGMRRPRPMSVICVSVLCSPRHQGAWSAPWRPTKWTLCCTRQTVWASSTCGMWPSTAWRNPLMKRPKVRSFWWGMGAGWPGWLCSPFPRLPSFLPCLSPFISSSYPPSSPSSFLSSLPSLFLVSLLSFLPHVPLLPLLPAFPPFPLYSLSFSFHVFLMSPFFLPFLPSLFLPSLTPFISSACPPFSLPTNPFPLLPSFLPCLSSFIYFSRLPPLPTFSLPSLSPFIFSHALPSSPPPTPSPPPNHFFLTLTVCVVDPWPVMLSWRGHVESVSSIDLVEQNKVLLTSSSDCTVRMWTTEGHYIGETSCHTCSGSVVVGRPPRDTT